MNESPWFARASSYYLGVRIGYSVRYQYTYIVRRSVNLDGRRLRVLRGGEIGAEAGSERATAAEDLVRHDDGPGITG